MNEMKSKSKNQWVGANAIKGIKAFHDFIPSKKKERKNKNLFLLSSVYGKIGKTIDGIRRKLNS